MGNTKFDTADIEGIYEAYEQSFLASKDKKVLEEADTAGKHKQDLPREKGKKPGKGETKAELTDGGPEEEGGFEEPKLDPNKVGDNDEYETKKFSALSEKTDKPGLNNGMATKFDKLYESVMDGEADALGLDYEADDDVTGLDGDEGMGDEDLGGEDITLTLSPDAAQALYDALHSVLGADEGLGDEGLEDEGMGDEGLEDDDEDGNPFGEGVDIKEVPDSTAKLTSTAANSHKVGDSNVDASAGSGGDGKVTDKVGNDGEKGHPVKDDTDKGNLKNTKNFKVSASKGNKPGQNAFKD